MAYLQAKLQTKIIAIFDQDHLKERNIIPSFEVILIIKVVYFLHIIIRLAQEY